VVAALSRSLTSKISLCPERQVNSWIARQLAEPKLKVDTASLMEIDGWSIEQESGNICHESGNFFTITGVHVRHRTPSGEIEWDQPLIDQAEVGILGILVKKIRGVLHFCLQAKEEPGNLNSVQLSPTVQATYSNYIGVHGGAQPMFIEHFLSPRKERLMFARLQSEDGGRFLYKSNRNMLVWSDDNMSMELPEGFIWLTLAQIAKLLKRENLVHATTRSVLSAVIVAAYNGCNSTPPQSAIQHEQGFISSIDDLFQWMDDIKSSNHILVKRKGLNELKEWGMDRDGSFSHNEGRFFRVIGVKVFSPLREVNHWCQPVLDNPGQGVIGLLVREYEGARFFLMQAKAEVGNRNSVQIAPTVQFTPGNYIGNTKLPKPFLFDEFHDVGPFPLLFESLQSEEGARFFKESHKHRIMLLPEGTELDLPSGFRWVSEVHLNFLLGMGGNVNSCARSILSCLLSLEKDR
jgi:oxidase EvaA